MQEKQFIYAVARIRSHEMRLLDAPFIEQLMSAKNVHECLQLLANKGWGRDGRKSPEQILDDEHKKAWDLIEELVDDMSAFDVFLLPNDYHNLKAAIKLVVSDASAAGHFIEHSTINPETILEAVRKKDYSLLPEHMQAAANEAYETVVQTGDGQLCDVIIDKAAMETLYEISKKQSNEVLRWHAEIELAASNIKIAVRGQETGKDLQWIRNAMVACDSLDIEALAKAAASSYEEIIEYLRKTDYAKGVDELEHSLSNFEIWCKNWLIRKIQPQKYNQFTIGPLAAFLLARENEIKTVRMILQGKLNQLPEEVIRERLRIMYV
ncbi:MAG: V-type ATPase subunit [Clostridiales bacterium]|nr:V-type ATPase subunit [Clostridiales bacterium]